MNFPAFFRHICDSEEFFLILHAQASCCSAKGDLLTFWTGVDLWIWEPEQTWDPHDRAMYSVGGRAEVKSPSTYFFSVPKKKTRDFLFSKLLLFLISVITDEPIGDWYRN